MIRMIALSGDSKSQYYSRICLDKWAELKYNIEIFEGTTPDTLGDELQFAPEKLSGSPFTEIEKAIWYSHFRLWRTVKEPTYVIEHDTYPFRSLPKFERFGFFSIFPRNEQAWQGVKETISPGSGYYIDRQTASILIEWALAREMNENVDGHIYQTFKKLSGLKEAEFQKKYLKDASCFQIVKYEIGTSAEHNT